MYSDTGDLEKAKEYHEWALKIKKQQLGANHVDVAASYNNLGIVYRNTGVLEKAKECYQLALKIQKEQSGANHVDVVSRSSTRQNPKPTLLLISKSKITLLFISKKLAIYLSTPRGLSSTLLKSHHSKVSK